MKAIHFQIGVTLDGETTGKMIEWIERAIERAVEQGTQRALQAAHKRAVEKEPPPKLKRTPLEASQDALLRGQNPPEDVRLLIDFKEAASLLKVSPRTIWRMRSSKVIPDPIRVGRAVRWRYDELKVWVEAGCPPQKKWQYPG